MDASHLQTYINFHSGSVPALGFGTYTLLQKDCIEAVTHALDVGYRHIDTARFYDNEADVGKAIKASSIAREDIFLTTKIWHTDLEPRPMKAAVEDSLKTLGVDYIDLLLIHWPSTDDSITYNAVEFLEEFRNKNYCKYIGASNFNLTLMEKSITIAPLVCNQIEYHPFLGQDKMVEFVNAHQLFLTAYCPLAQGAILQETLIKDLAIRHRKKPNQIALKWFLQQANVAVIPRASKESHRLSNFDVWDFELSSEEMEAINKLDQQKRLVDPWWSVDWAK